MPLQQAREFRAVGGGARFFGQIFQDHAGIVGAAEEGVIDLAADALVHLRAAPQQRGPKDCAQRDAGRLSDLDDRLQVTREGHGEQQRQTDADQR